MMEPEQAASTAGQPSHAPFRYFCHFCSIWLPLPCWLYFLSLPWTLCSSWCGAVCLNPPEPLARSKPLSLWYSRSDCATVFEASALPPLEAALCPTLLQLPIISCVGSLVCGAEACMQRVFTGLHAQGAGCESASVADLRVLACAWKQRS